MRKALTLFVLLIVLMQVMGYYIVFRARQLELKSEVMTYLKTHSNDHRLTHFEFTIRNGRIFHKDLEWREDDEFLFADKMYDVISKQVNGDKITLACLQDEKETELLDAFAKAQQTQSQDGKDKTASLLQFFSNLYVVTEFDVISSLPASSSNSYYSNHSPLIDRSGDILTPPPQDCLHYTI